MSSEFETASGENVPVVPSEEPVSSKTEKQPKFRERLSGTDLINNIIDTRGAYYCPCCGGTNHGVWFCETLKKKSKWWLSFAYMVIQQYVYKCCADDRISDFNLDEICRMLTDPKHGPRNWSLDVCDSAGERHIVGDSDSAKFTTQLPPHSIGCKVVYGHSIGWFYSDTKIVRMQPLVGISDISVFAKPIRAIEFFFEKNGFVTFGNERAFLAHVGASKGVSSGSRPSATYRDPHREAEEPRRVTERPATAVPKSTFIEEFKTILMSTPDDKLRMTLAALAKKYNV
jgi:hypothetical protein